MEDDVPCAHAAHESACLTDRYFQHYDALAVKRCELPSGTHQVDRSVQIELFYGPDRDERDVVDVTSRLQRYYEPHGLHFSTSAAAAPTDLRYVMDGTSAQIESALADADIPLHATLTDAEAQRAHRIVGSVIFSAMRTFVARHHNATTRHTIALVVLDQVVAPELSRYLFDSPVSGLTGFGLSAEMLAAVDQNDPERELYEITGLPDSFTPVAFIGQGDIDDVGLVSDNVVAHETGHALGLVHTDDPDNLMYPAPWGDCDASLSAAQIAQLAAALR